MPKPIRTLHEGDYTGIRYKAGAVYHYIVDIPDFSEGKRDLALFVSHDGYQWADADAMYDLALTGECPPFIGIGISSGELPSALGEAKLGIRQNTYDPPTSDYSDFVVEELIPFLVEKYHLSLSPDPDMHVITGGSSGGISAFTAAWYRTDFFRRVYMSSPSFIDLMGGEAFLSKIRKHEPKPIRVYSEYSEYDALCDYGSDITAGQETENALRYAGYDAAYNYRSGFWHVSHYNNFEAALVRMRFLWKNWQTEKIAPKGHNSHFEKFIDITKPWEKAEIFPEKVRALSTGKFSAPGEYLPEGDKVVFVTPEGERRVVAEGFNDITGIAISGDKWRLFLCDKTKPHGTFMRILPDGSLEGNYLHGVLETELCGHCQGGYDLCVDTDSRTYVATETGIQMVRYCGIADVILANPDGKPAVKVEMGDDGCLYALTADGTVYRRPLLTGKRPTYDEATMPPEINF